MRWERSNILERIKASWPLVNIITILLLLVTMILNVFTVWVLVMWLHSVQTKESWL